MVNKVKEKIFRLIYRVSSPIKNVLQIIIPKKILRRVKESILKDVNYRKTEEVRSLQGEFGVNLVGYARAEMGIGESCRIAANTLSHTNIPFGIINFSGTNSARKEDTTWAYAEIDKPKYNINLIHINAEQIPEVYLLHGKELFADRYNIGYWHWELPDFPDNWLNSFNYLDEIWVPSNYVRDSISVKSPIPVVKVPHSIEVKISTLRERAYFYLPENKFLFLTMYDINSVQERKNPKASIEAFKLAFEYNDDKVGLVVKVNGKKEDLRKDSYLNSLVNTYKNIFVIDETISRNDMNSLLAITDCFISLHRSEGFGLGFAEAMYLGKPVIGTNWSSNTDFMNSQNSCLVNYELTLLGRDYGPYKSDQYWAEPDIEHASKYMRKLTNDVHYYNEISRNGQNFIKSTYSPFEIGKTMRKRIDYITKWKYGGTIK